MAKLKSIIKLEGSLEGMTFYKLQGVEEYIVRAASGPSKEQIETDPKYDLLRRNLSENRGRNKAVHWLMKAFQPLKPIADFDTAGKLNKLLRVIQKDDTVSEWSKRAILLSHYPSLLEGFCLTKALPFDEVVRGEVRAQLDRHTLTASVELPELLPGLKFFPPAGYAYCRLVAVLGIAPDLLFEQLQYQTNGDYGNCYTQSVVTDWFPAGKGAPATTLSLELPYSPPTEAFSLVLSVGVQLGEPGLAGSVEPVRKRIGSAKILAAV